MSHNLQKKPTRGILKTSRSVDAHDTPSTSSRPKEQRFDEMNIIETFHPADKEYGHMKIDEPKTPYAEPLDMEAQGSDALDASELAAKLTAAADAPPRCTQQPDSSDEEETEEQRRHRIDFEKKRKSHYNEFQALQLARKLMEQDEEEEDEDEGFKCNAERCKATGCKAPGCLNNK